MKVKEEKLSEAHADLVKLRNERDKVIDTYMEKNEFIQVMRAHDDSVFSGFFKTGWDTGLALFMSSSLRSTLLIIQAPRILLFSS